MSPSPRNEGSALNPIRATARKLQAPLPLVADVKMRANGARPMTKESKPTDMLVCRHAARQRRRPTVRQRLRLRVRAGFTLVELIFSMSVLSFSAAVFGGLMLAVNSGWDHATALEESRRQAQTSLSRIKWMVQQAGTYRVTGRPTTLGVAVIPTNWGSYQAPTMLVVWSGGSSGGMNAQGLQSRLPLASELVVYCPHPTAPTTLVEATFPTSNSTVDFASASFSSTIQSLLTSTTPQYVKLCDRLHVTVSTQAGLPTLANIRFEMTSSPTDTDIAAVTVGSQGWNNLSWSQGLIAADRALRTTNLRIELMLDPNPKLTATNNGYTTAIPFPGSVNRQYVYQP